MTERLLCAREVAELLGLSPATVLDRFEAGDLPGFKLYGRRGGPVRFRWSEVAAALERWRTTAAPGQGECHQTLTGAAALRVDADRPTLRLSPNPAESGPTEEN